jgi:hypothetical protein
MPADRHPTGGRDRAPGSGAVRYDTSDIPGDNELITPFHKYCNVLAPEKMNNGTRMNADERGFEMGQRGQGIKGQTKHLEALCPSAPLPLEAN